MCENIHRKAFMVHCSYDMNTSYSTYAKHFSEKPQKLATPFAAATMAFTYLVTYALLSSPEICYHTLITAEICYVYNHSDFN